MITTNILFWESPWKMLSDDVRTQNALIAIAIMNIANTAVFTDSGRTISAPIPKQAIPVSA